jgi:hypothetical protein
VFAVDIVVIGHKDPEPLARRDFGRGQGVGHWEAKRKASFCEQKEAKKLCLIWAALVAMSQAALFKKRPLSGFRAAGLG